jgi:hypothetical protein
MKTMISDDGGYATFVEVLNIECLKDHKHLKITSTYINAIDPTDELNELSMILSPEAYERLVNAIK